MRHWTRRLAAVAAIAYLVALFIVFVLLRFVGERWWATGVGLYLPRIGFLLPLPFTVGALALFGPRRLLYTQIAAALLAFFPLMGFVVSLPSRHSDPSLRVLSFNVDSVYFGRDTVVSAITQYSPDIVLVQELFDNSSELRTSLSARYPVVQTSTQFLVATKFPIVSVYEPDKLAHEGRQRSARFLRYNMKTPLGDLAVYNVHPISPRYGMYEIRGSGLRKEILSGRFFRAERTADMQGDSDLRASQVETFATMATAEKTPVILAGDTNLPTLSPVLNGSMSPFVDGFGSSGFGFGYTFPAKFPWMRIDRIMTSHDLTFESFTVGCKGASDHLCVVADIRRR